jgi:hypothetical protein
MWFGEKQLKHLPSNLLLKNTEPVELTLVLCELDLPA